MKIRLERAIIAITTVWALRQFGAMPKIVDGLWVSLIGSAMTAAIASLSAGLRGSTTTTERA